MTKWKWFFYRRLHSLTGLGLVIFLAEHLFINSQAAFPLVNGSSSYITAVNYLQAIPYLALFELLLLGLPFLLHTYWGIVYLRTGVYGIPAQDGSVPVLPTKNHYAYILQRWTAWFLVGAILLHVAHMRFISRPKEIVKENRTSYEVSVTPGISWDKMAKELGPSVTPIQEIVSTTGHARQLEAVDFGTAELLVMRETFISPAWMLFYSLLVLAAAFHASQGFWTFLLSWGVTIAPKSQRVFRYISILLFCTFTTLGLIAIFGTYWTYGR